MSQGQVEIIASQQKMIADCDAMKLQTTAFTGSHMNQTEVRRPSADVAYQNCLAGRYDLVPLVAMCIHPRIKRGLRLFQQHDSRQPGDSRGRDGQFPSDLIKRRGDREYDILFRQRMVGVPSVPRISHVPQISSRRFDR